jgi:pyruvate/2-oxoacid:ferredoxin oxidoreductase beta subunit
MARGTARLRHKFVKDRQCERFKKIAADNDCRSGWDRHPKQNPHPDKRNRRRKSEQVCCPCAMKVSVIAFGGDGATLSEGIGIWPTE